MSALSAIFVFKKKICTQSHSAEFLNWGNHVNSVPDLAVSPPPCSWVLQSSQEEIENNKVMYNSGNKQGALMVNIEDINILL